MSATMNELGRAIRDAHDETLAERGLNAPHEAGHDAQPWPARVARVQAELARRQLGAMVPARRWPRGLAACAVAAAAALLLLVYWPASAIVAEHRGQSLPVGAAVTAADAPESIELSDGSRLRLAPQASLQLQVLDDRGAHVALSTGVLHVAVKHREQTRWIVSAGDFDIVVTGTRFDAAWDARAEQLRVTMQEGSVRVEGSCLPEPRRLVAGQSAAFSCRPDEARPAGAVGRAGGVGADDKRRNDQFDGSESRPGKDTAAGGASAALSAAASAAVLSWHELAKQSKFREAMAAAEKQGFSSICVSAGSGEVLELGDVARLAGNPARAGEAYRAVRQRFGGSGAAAQAAFMLGRMAFDGAGDYAAARRWFSAYLAESGGGGLAQEALGRLLEAEHRLGDQQNARRTAERYLARYPDGAHAALARSLTQP